METQKHSELRVRLRRVKSGSSKLKPGIAAVPGTSKTALASKSSESEDEDFATVHFKLAAALEAAAKHASDLNLDWRHPKASRPDSDAMNASEVKTVEPISQQVQPRMQEPNPQQKEGSDSEDEEDEKLVELILATPSSSACSTEDEGTAELQGEALSSMSPLGKYEGQVVTPGALNTTLSDEAGAIIDNGDNQVAAVRNILELPPFDPYAPQFKVQLIIKQIVSLAQLKQRIVDNSKGAISKNGPISECDSVAEMEFANIHVKHSLEEFFTFCSCKNCLEYREIVVHLMVAQFKAQHMVVMLVEALMKAYSPMLKNATAHNKFEKLLDANKEICWMTCGYIYNKMNEHMYFIYDESLSDNMILVLFSAILLVNNPLLLLQVLSFHVACVVKAYAEGFLEIVDPDNSKIPAEEMLKYILDGYDDLCRISERISCYLFAFENDFLRKFSLTWTLLCQRLYQQHVYLNLTDTMLACIITLKEDELTARHAALIKKYIRFDDKMLYVDKRWTDIWMELNKFNLSDVERKRRMCLMDVHRIFEVVVQDAIELSTRESTDDNDFFDFHTLENRQLAWQNIMAYMKMKWPDGFYNPPNTLVCEDKCKNCNVLLEYHAETCKCITCSIAGGPMPPRRNPDNTCYKCLALQLVEKEVTFYESKILNVCASDDFLSFIKSNEKRKSSTLEELGVEVCSALAAAEEQLAPSDPNDSSGGTYHLAWAVFRHLNNRKRYKNTSIDAKCFCSQCEFQACRLARKILNNEIEPKLSLHLIKYYQPLSMSREELRSILPNIMLYNRKMVSSNMGLDLNDVHDLVVKIYWTFVISLYATYFIEFRKDCPLRLEHFELVSNDIKLQTANLTGNKDDTDFVLFLDKLKGLSCDKDELKFEVENPEDEHSEEMQKKLDEFLKTNKSAQNSPQIEKIHSTESSTEGVPTANVAAESSNKRSCKDKSKKCCFDHSDLGDHCKENHSSKKRIKKECNHARMNETRDRLRKKLSQLVNARKNIKAAADKQSAAQNPKTSQPPNLKTSSKTAACCGVSVKTDAEGDSLECLNTLCKRINHINTGKPDAMETTPPPTTKPTTHSNAGTLSPVNKKHTQNSLAKEASCRANVGNSQKQASEKRVDGRTVSAPAAAGEAAAKKNGSGLDMVNEIYELLGSYSKDQSKVKKWINETLSYIEGSSGGNNGKQQPQPTNAKKAAKKAKQKQRKEEEKRIAELQDLRGQFYDIYFKEFVDKYDLKEMKSSKKRDKKKISELEANVKKLQRAKAKVETAILELIATVKQTNAEFKFSYLPTKEQQLEKLRELKGEAASDPGNSSDPSKKSLSADASQQQTETQQFMASSVESTDKNLGATSIAAGNYSLPYAHANNFPYHQLDMKGGVAPNSSSFGMIRPPLPTPMCYAPPQHQQLPPDVVAAMAANAACHSTNDPSKRIVTIRRVNLPNVPEPQVTVTAKGSSPDKDKLLYTFVNGQLLQNGATVPPITQPPGVSLQTPNVPATAANQLITAPAPPLSKTQLKKERRRLAQKAAEEAEAALKAEKEKMLEDELKLQKEKDSEAAAKKNKRKPKDSIKDKLSVEPQTVKHSVAKSKKKKKPVTVSSASTTSISTTDATELAAATYATSTHRRSSSATSYSAAIPSSHVSTSSQINTRDNSVCSQNANSKLAKAKQVSTSNDKQGQKQLKKVNQQQPHKKPSTPPQIQPVIQELKPPQSTEHVTESNDEKRKTKRHKLIDNGQFDNNPFKSLHMQNLSSDSEFCSSSCDEEEEENTIEAEHKSKEVQKPDTVTPKSKTTKMDQPRKYASDAETTIEVCKKQQQTKNPNPKRVLKTESEKRDEIPKAAPTKPENQRSAKPDKDSQRGRTQELSVKQVDPTAQPRNQQQRKKSNQLRYSGNQLASQATTTNKRSSVTNTRNDRASNQRMPAVSSSALPPGPSANRNYNRSSARNDVAASAEHLSRNPSETASKPASKRSQKQAQRNKHKTQKQHTNNDLYAGIPNNMGYFNASDFTIPSPQQKQQQKQFQQLKQSQQQQYKTIQQQMQNLHLGTRNQSAPSQQLSSADSPRQSSSEAKAGSSSCGNSVNISIMDQLNRGVQVENLSLPPGITLTKVDPAKSELLRKKSESIKKLAKPLQPQPQQLSQSFHHPGATIIAPPVASVSGYYGLPYAGVAAAAALGQNGGSGNVIMLEAMPSTENAPTKPQQVKSNVAAAAAAAAAAASKAKSSKSKKRRNKSKPASGSRQSASNSSAKADLPTVGSDGQPKMVTLRNPMFHSGPPGAAAATILQQPALMKGRTIGGLPIAATLPMDQPASIIKNENGMFTIRNPALQQAVANGLAIGGYRQFGNVNYYTPQEAVAEAARATQLNTANAGAQPSAEDSTFSYFSNSSISDQPQQIEERGGAVSGSTTASSNAGELNCPEFSRSTQDNDISISCTRVMSGNGGLTGDSAVIARPVQPPKCISAIGSEIKSAQQQKQKSIEQQWTNFGQDLASNANSSDALACSSSYLSGGSRNAITNSPIQDKYQHSNYYNGFDVFPANSTGSQIPTCGRSSHAGSLFDASDCHLNHNCGDDSPPPTITGFNHYLEGIPNTGVIRYDDATFLKTLMPGQNLNNEVSIHNVNDSSFTRNSASPLPHRVEISTVYANRTTSENIYEHCSNSSTNYRETLNEYGNDANLFVPNSLLNLNEMDSVNHNADSFKGFSYDFEQHEEKPEVHVNVNDLLMSNASSVSSRASPYMDENAMEQFVQNINAMQISAPAVSRADEQSAQLNSGSGGSGACKNTTNGWW